MNRVRVEERGVRVSRGVYVINRAVALMGLFINSLCRAYRSVQHEGIKLVPRVLRIGPISDGRRGQDGVTHILIKPDRARVGSDRFPSVALKVPDAHRCLNSFFSSPSHSHTYRNKHKTSILLNDMAVF